MCWSAGHRAFSCVDSYGPPHQAHDLPTTAPPASCREHETAHLIGSHARKGMSHGGGWGVEELRHPALRTRFQHPSRISLLQILFGHLQRIFATFGHKKLKLVTLRNGLQVPRFIQQDSSEEWQPPARKN